MTTTEFQKTTEGKYQAGVWTIEPNGTNKWGRWALCYEGERVNRYPTVKAAKEDLAANEERFVQHVINERQRIAEGRHI